MGQKITQIIQNKAEYGELVAKNGSPLLMKIHLNIINYQETFLKLTKHTLSFLDMKHLHFDDFYNNGFITPDRNKIHLITRDSFYPFIIDHGTMNIDIMATPVQLTDKEVKMLNKGKFYVKPYFTVSQKYGAWALDTITFNLDKKL